MTNRLKSFDYLSNIKAKYIAQYGKDDLFSTLVAVLDDNSINIDLKENLVGHLMEKHDVLMVRE